MTDYGDAYEPPSTTSGWVAFSGVIMAMAGLVNLLYALSALLKDDWIVLTPEALIRFDLTTVGVIFLIFGAVQLFVSFGIFHGALWARILGVIGASLNIIAQMSFMSLYPAWAWLVIIIDGLVIYGLTVHGDEVAEL